MALLFNGAEPFMQILEVGIMGNIHVKLFEIWSSGSRRTKNKLSPNRFVKS